MSNSKLYVSGLPWKTTPEAVSSFFSPAGLVVEVDIIRDKRTMRSKGFGFVTMSTEQEADKAKEMFDGKNFGERFLKVEFATPKKEWDDEKPATEKAETPAPAAEAEAAPETEEEDEFTSF